MTKFTKEQLEKMASQECFCHEHDIQKLWSTFALALMERAENAEKQMIYYQDRTYLLDNSLLNAEAERDRLKGELREAEDVIRFADIMLRSDGYSWNLNDAVRRARERGGRGKRKENHE